MRKKLLLVCTVIAIMSFMTNNKQKDNTLSKKEKKEGWVLLFDGTTTNGWRPYKNKEQQGWDVKDGELYCKSEGVTKRADLITANKYENFELQIDWKISPKMNSGIIYMATEENGASYESGPEYQLIDDIGYPGKLSDKQLSGANYDMNAPTAKISKPAGEFNHTKIVINKGHVEHWLNGTKVVDYQLWTPEWEQTKANSKWKDVKPYGMAKSGHIALQDHGGGIAFKNIKIKPL
jgi:3-keto-disaccharide hydrolase